MFLRPLWRLAELGEHILVLGKGLLRPVVYKILSIVGSSSIAAAMVATFVGKLPNRLIIDGNRT